MKIDFKCFYYNDFLQKNKKIKLKLYNNTVSLKNKVLKNSKNPLLMATKLTEIYTEIFIPNFNYSKSESSFSRFKKQEICFREIPKKFKYFSEENQKYKIKLK